MLWFSLEVQEYRKIFSQCNKSVEFSEEVSSQSFEIFSSPEKSFENCPMESTILKSFINEASEGAEEVSDLNKITENINSTVSHWESLVTNFPRHILRNYSGEIVVMKILSSSTGLKERKNLLHSLENKGNYLTLMKSSNQSEKEL
ncbi:hypothetical protein WA026_015637 [Henosepilachna vigintioctopunctata]|uniref:Uncharacterized protein n=1 Tax=Henosepilachna vigintioctopunctata TaxID=420089 RepID=A0AAW1VAE7_9CUCU